MECQVVNDNGSIPSSGSDLEDSVLAAQVSKGDVAAFALLYDRYASVVYTMAIHLLGRSDADEMVQEVFLQLWLKADQYDVSRGSFNSWLMAIARHRMLREMNTRSRRQRMQAIEDIDNVLSRVADSTGDVEDRVWRQEQAQIVRAGLGALPEEQRGVILLAYFGGLSQSAIARHLDLPLGTVKKRTRLGFQKLRRTLEPGHPQVPAQSTAKNRPQH